MIGLNVKGRAINLSVVNIEQYRYVLGVEKDFSKTPKALTLMESP